MSEDTANRIQLAAVDAALNTRNHCGARAGFYLGYIDGAAHQHLIAFEQGRIQGKFEAIDHILESMESGEVQTWVALLCHLKGLKEAAIKSLKP